jgi:hypothetical protein
VNDALDRRDRLAAYGGQRGSMVLLTERRQAVGPIVCEVCDARHPGGIARGVVLDEPGGDTVWLLWVLVDGWSLADHSQIAVCPEHQANTLLKTLRFNDETTCPAQ